MVDMTTFESVFTVEETWDKHDDNELQSLDHDVSYLPVDFVTEVVVRLSLIFVGSILNVIILKCYFRVKSSRASYIRAFAVLDILILFSGSFEFFFLNLFPAQAAFSTTFKSVFRALAAFSLLGPLFLALDRCLIVIVPHKVSLYVAKMRIFKIILFVLTSLVGVGFLATSASIGVVFIYAFATVVVLLQLIGCLVLYLIIIAQILASERKLGAHRHFGNT